MPTVVVTGAAGFIGSHTCELLLAGGNAVVGVDNFRTGSRDNLRVAQRAAAFDLRECDVAAGSALAEIVGRVRPDAIVHLAALVSVPESVADPAANFRLNVAATQIVADVAREHRVPRVVFASSAAVYGDIVAVPIREDAATRPISPYGGAKLASEALLLSQAESFGFVARCLRYFNVFGPRQDPRSPYSGVISIFESQLRRGLAPTILGDGEQTRDFISVHDVARANVIAATSAAVRTGVANICTGQSTSLNRLAAAMRRFAPPAPPSQHGPARRGDIRHSVGSADRAAAELGFTAAVSLEQGLRELLG